MVQLMFSEAASGDFKGWDSNNKLVFGSVLTALALWSSSVGSGVRQK